MLLKKIYRHLLHTGFLASAGIDKQVLDSFFRELDVDKGNKNMPGTTSKKPGMKKVKELLAFTDGASLGNPGPSGIGVSLLVDGIEVEGIAKHIGNTTNNVAEYMALLAALQAAKKYEPEFFLVKMDSQLIVRQLEGVYKVKKAHLKPLFDEAKSLIKQLNKVSVVHVPREENTRADALSRQAIPGQKK